MFAFISPKGYTFDEKGLTIGRAATAPGYVCEEVLGENNGAPGTIRTCDLLVRSQTLYPAELRAQGGNRLR